MKPRFIAAILAAGAGVAATAALAVLPPGLAAGQPGRLAALVLGQRGFWAAWIVGLGLVGLLLMTARVWLRADGYDTATVLRLAEPLLWGTGLPLLALALDPWFFDRTAPLLAAAGTALGVVGSARRRAQLPPRSAAAGRRPVLPLIVAMSIVVPALLVMPGPPWFHPISGDEPHYLVTARSIWVDGDLDLADEYTDTGLLAPFWPYELSAHAKPGADPAKRYSIHGTGLAVWLAPWYGLGRGLDEEAFNVLIRIAMSLWLAAAAAALFILLRDIAGRLAAERGTVLAVFTLPLLFAGPHLFPAVPVFALSCAAYVILRRAPGPAGALGAGLLLAGLPWLHFKFLGLMAAVAAAGAVALWREREARSPRPSLAALGAPLLLTCLGHMAFTWRLYGRLSPLAIHLGSDPTLRAPAAGDDWLAYLGDPGGVLRTGIGYFMDQREGLLFYAPQYLLAVAGFAWLWRRRRADAWGLSLAAASLVVPYALSQEIGHWGPPARPLTGILWTLAVPMGIGLLLPAQGPAGRRRTALRGVLIGWGIGATVLLLLQADLLYHDFGAPRSLVLLRYGAPGLPLAELAPSWIGPAGLIWPAALFWLAVAIVAGVELWRWGAAAAAGFEPGADDRASVPEPRLGPAGAGATAAAATVLMVAAFLLWHHARVPLSALHEPWGYEAMRYWRPLSPPTRAWPDERGIWTGGSDSIDLLISSPRPLSELVFEVNSLAPMQADIQVGRDRQSVKVDPERRTFARFAPGPATSWQGQYFYHLEIDAHGGISPAALGRGDDGRGLGVLLEVVETEESPPR